MTCANPLNHRLNAQPLLGGTELVKVMELNLPSENEQTAEYKNIYNQAVASEHLWARNFFPAFWLRPDQFEKWFHDLSFLGKKTSLNIDFVKEPFFWGAARLGNRILPFLQEQIKKYPRLTIDQRRFLIEVSSLILPAEEWLQFFQKRYLAEDSDIVMSEWFSAWQHRNWAPEMASQIVNTFFKRKKRLFFPQIKALITFAIDEQIKLPLSTVVNYLFYRGDMHKDELGEYQLLQNSLPDITPAQVRKINETGVSLPLLDLYLLEQDLLTVPEIFPSLLKIIPEAGFWGKQGWQKIKAFLKEHGDDPQAAFDLSYRQAFLKAAKNSHAGAAVVHLGIDPQDLTEAELLDLGQNELNERGLVSNHYYSHLRALKAENAGDFQTAERCYQELYNSCGLYLSERETKKGFALIDSLSPFGQKTINQMNQTFLTAFRKAVEDYVPDSYPDANLPLKKVLEFYNQGNIKTPLATEMLIASRLKLLHHLDPFKFKTEIPLYLDSQYENYKDIDYWENLLDYFHRQKTPYQQICLEHALAKLKKEVTDGNSWKITRHLLAVTPKFTPQVENDLCDLVEKIYERVAAGEHNAQEYAFLAAALLGDGASSSDSKRKIFQIKRRFGENSLYAATLQLAEHKISVRKKNL